MKAVLSELKKEFPVQDTNVKYNDRRLVEIIGKIKHSYAIKDWPTSFSIDRTLKKLQNKNVYKKVKLRVPIRRGMLTIVKADSLLEFQSKRILPSTFDRFSQTIWTFSVMESSAGILYTLKAEDSSRVYSSRDIDQVWTQVLEEAYRIRGLEYGKIADGRYYSGFDCLKVHFYE